MCRFFPRPLAIIVQVGLLPQLIGCAIHTRERKAADALEQLTAPSEDRNLRTAALDALAATGDSARASQVALRLVADPDPLFAQAAVADAAKVGGASARAALTAALQKESRVFVRLAIQTALKPQSGPPH